MERNSDKSGLREWGLDIQADRLPQNERPLENEEWWPQREAGGWPELPRLEVEADFYRASSMNKGMKECRRRSSGSCWKEDVRRTWPTMTGTTN